MCRLIYRRTSIDKTIVNNRDYNDTASNSYQTGEQPATAPAANPSRTNPKVLTVTSFLTGLPHS